MYRIQVFASTKILNRFTLNVLYSFTFRTPNSKICGSIDNTLTWNSRHFVKLRRNEECLGGKETQEIFLVKCLIAPFMKMVSGAMFLFCLCGSFAFDFMIFIWRQFNFWILTFRQIVKAKSYIQVSSRLLRVTRGGFVVYVSQSSDWVDETWNRHSSERGLIPTS